MHLFVCQIFVMITLFPIWVWATNVQYFLDVEVDTQSHKLIGTARLIATESQDLTLSVDNLSALRINDKTVTTLNEQITVNLLYDQELIISYEVVLDNGRMHFVNQDNVFLTGK